MDRYLKLEDRDHLFRALFERIATSLVICNIDGMFIDVNKPFCELVGYTKDELLRMSFRDITHPEDLAYDLLKKKQAITTKQDNYDTEKRYIHKNGRVVWVKLSISLVRDENDQARMFFGTIEDITLRKQTEQQLEESQKDWAQIFEAIHHPAILLDKNYIITNINRAVLGFSHKTREDLIGMSCFTAFKDPNKEDLIGECPIENMLKSCGIESTEIEVSFGKKTYIISCTPVIDEYKTLKNTILILTEITKQKDVEKALLESEERYRAMVETAPVGIVIHAQGKILFVNEYGVEMIGAKSLDHLREKSVMEIIHPSCRQQTIHRIGRMLAGEKDLYPTQDKYLSLNGDAIDVEVYAKEINYNGQPAILGIVTNITENLKAKERLSEFERRFTNIMNSVNLVSITLDTKANITFCNQYFLDLTGYHFDEVINKSLFELFIPEHRIPYFKDVFFNAIETKTIIIHFDIEILTKDGSVLIVSWNNTFLRGANSEIIGTASIGENITERKRIENKLVQAHNELKALHDNLDEAIFSYDVQKKEMLQVSIAHEKVFGYPLQRFFDRPELWHELIIADDLPIASKCLVELLAGRNQEIEVRIDRADYQIRWINAKLKPTLSGEGRMIRVDGIISDITERKLVEEVIIHKNYEYQLLNKEYLALNEELSDSLVRVQSINDQLLKAKEKAEESDRLKTAFLQNMSHEIRTPLNAIMGFSELLRMSIDDREKQIRFAGIIVDRGQYLLNIINDILDISKIESGQLRLYIEPVALKTICADIVDFFNEFKVKTEKTDIVFKTEMQESLYELIILTDATKLKQILINLITNAFKFTDEGSITVGCTQINERELQFHVIDTGIGIEAEKHAAVFQRFTQANSNTARLYGGTGLGLSIVQGLLQLMGGQIWLESKPNVGTTFYFTLPCIQNQ